MNSPFNYTSTSGACDLITYFIRRIYSLINANSFLSIISTSSISQGDTREGGLKYIIENGANIIFAVKSMKWLGVANVDVALLSIFKGDFNKKKVLNYNKVNMISSYLDDEVITNSPLILLENKNKSFIGSFVLGTGFIISDDLVSDIFDENIEYKKVIMPYLNGDDINSFPSQTPSRWVINFQDWSEDYCKLNYPICYEILLKEIKPVRDNDNRKSYRENWWHFAEKRPKLYETIKNLNSVLGISRRSKHVVFSVLPKEIVYSEATVILAVEKKSKFLIISSSLHDVWAWKYGGTLGAMTIAYNPSDILETFPFPQNLHSNQEQTLEKIGESYHEHRRLLMLEIQLGLTKTYNLFHAANLQGFKNLEGFNTNEDFNPKTFEKTYGKDAAYLFKHLLKTFTNESLSQTVARFTTAVNGIIKLRELHVQMDEAVLDAYAWNDIALKHDFYEVDYLPENDRVRFTIHPDARKEVLKRLLELNHTVYEQEIREGLHKEEDVKKFYEQKGVPIPAEVILKMAELKLLNKTNSKKAKPKKGFEGMADMYGE